jgi:hypothetical protein
MAEDQEEPEPTQYTPKGHEIPIPTREQVFRDLEKVAKPRKRPASPSKGRLRRPKEK